MFFLAVILISHCVSCNFAQTYDSSTIFLNNEIVQGPDKYLLYWNFTDTDIIFKVVVNHTGWIGFGLSPNGGMENADIVIAFRQTNGSFHFTDRSAYATVRPTVDQNQDYTLLFSSQTNGITTIIFKRKIKICNDNPNEIDMDIETGTNFVIFAWGDIRNNDILYHGTNKLSKSLPLISTLNRAINFDMNGVETIEFRVNVIF